MDCSHDGFHGFVTHYDQSRGELVYLWTCETCRAELKVAHREAYRPSFDPKGNERHLAVAARRS